MSITYAIEKSYKKEDKSLSKIFKPRRGTENTMKTVKSNTVLAAGELFAELPNTGPGTGKGRLVMGDGVTAYGNLPSFVENTDVSTAQVTVTADNSATSTAAINNVSSGATTGALIGSLKQAISLTKSELTNTIDELMEEGIGMTDEQAAQLAALYNQVVYNKKLGDIITCSLTGSHTNASYQLQICYLTTTKICLLGYTNLGNANWSTCCGYSWTVSIPAGSLVTNAITKTNVRIPTLENIYSTTANYKRDFHYWTSTPYSSYAWLVGSDGAVTSGGTSYTRGALPYVIIDL